ncbi:hypothetical protein GOBAR_AA24348 [Gossypium barbadense]|uniref:Piwi domain-containing protein n=1 Tax=Gossypium barbadense TaxID=3634 RepID=A0A2P5WYZ0_GOSBA|nr:hypothetical protein GOBAR_AA24348 [Gossypium barbadense]
MTETGKNWHKKLQPTLYAYAGANNFNSSCFKGSNHHPWNGCIVWLSLVVRCTVNSCDVSNKVDDSIMKEALLDFYTSSGKRKHDQIVIFRDGVSESQFNQVLIKLLRLASSLTRSGTQKIVVIVGSPDNVLHGTVIDNKVCHPKNNDFYLGTYTGMIGITRQTHYHVLLDQAGFLADDLQEFLHSWGQFMKIRDALETSSSYGGMYAPGVISVPQLSRLKDKGLTNNSQDYCWGNPFLMGL